MTYSESLAWLYATQQFGVKLGLDNTIHLLEAVGNPHDGLRIFHVAGTNGKGSVCAILDAVLRKAGLRTGLYTSPHLIDFRERVRIDGCPVPRPDVARWLTRLRAAGAGHSPTFFEVATVLALGCFAEAGCEAVVLETGMGGRLDATNVVEPVVSVLTPVAMDHAEWLGDTLTKIAGEKAGIIKRGTPAVSAPQTPDVVTVFEARAAAMGAPLSFVSAPWAGPVGLVGGHQKWNAALAARALEVSEIPVAPEALAGGIASVHWPARFQRVGERIVVDGAHNPHSAAALAAIWREVFGGQKAVVVFGALGDKDASGMLRALEPIAERFVFVPVQSARAVPASTFAGLTTHPSVVCESLADGIAQAGELALVTGSLFLAGEALAHLGVPPFEA